MRDKKTIRGNPEAWESREISFQECWEMFEIPSHPYEDSPYWEGGFESGLLEGQEDDTWGYSSKYWNRIPDYWDRRTEALDSWIYTLEIQAWHPELCISEAEKNELMQVANEHKALGGAPRARLGETRWMYSSAEMRGNPDARRFVKRQAKRAQRRQQKTLIQEALNHY